MALSIMLTAFSLLILSCQTTEGVAVEIVHPPLPIPADLRPVGFEDDPENEGLLLKYGEYRALAHNIIEYRREIADLRAVLAFYRSDKEENYGPVD